LVRAMHRVIVSCPNQREGECSAGVAHRKRNQQQRQREFYLLPEKEPRKTPGFERRSTNYFRLRESNGPGVWLEEHVGEAPTTAVSRRSLGSWQRLGARGMETPQHGFAASCAIAHRKEKRRVRTGIGKGWADTRSAGWSGTSSLDPHHDSRCFSRAVARRNCKEKCTASTVLRGAGSTRTRVSSRI
jgi:hypothetical protein